MTITSQVAEFAESVSFDKISPAELKTMKRSILDTIGVSIAGSSEPACRIVEELIKETNCTPRALVIGRDLKCSVRDAALYNGVAAHVLDYDDVQLSTSKGSVFGLLTHPSSPVLGALLALAQQEPSSGRDLIASFYAGTEVACRIADSIDASHYQRGFHSSGTIGGLGATVSCGKLLQLGRRQMKVALGIAASMSAGLRRNFGTMTKAWHVGRAAETGVLAAKLSSKGFTAADDILDANLGLIGATSDASRFSKDRTENRLGRPHFYVEPGIVIKPHPSATLAHPAMSAFLSLVKESNLSPEDIVSVDVGTNSYIPTALMYNSPTSPLEAKFSMPFNIAVLLHREKAGLYEYKQEVLGDPLIRESMKKVRLYVDPASENAGYNRMVSIVTIKLRNGQTLRREREFAHGHPKNPMSDEDLAAKFVDNASVVLQRQNIDALVEGIGKLEEAKNIIDLVSIMH